MNIKIQRIRKRIRQLELSKSTGVGRTTIVKIEKGQIDGIRFGILKRVALALDSTLEDLFL